MKEGADERREIETNGAIVSMSKAVEFSAIMAARTGRGLAAN